MELMWLVAVMLIGVGLIAIGEVIASMRHDRQQIASRSIFNRGI
jgi:hypothetical protein